MGDQQSLPALPADALVDPFPELTRPDAAEWVARTRTMHRLLADGVTVEYRKAEGEAQTGRPTSEQPTFQLAFSRSPDLRSADTEAQGRSRAALPAPSRATSRPAFGRRSETARPC